MVLIEDKIGLEPDASGEAVRTIDYVYDSLDRLTQENWMGSGDSIVNSIDYTYNADGQVTSASDDQSAQSYTYDGDGNVSSVSNSGTPDAPTVVENELYDPDGNLLSLSAAVSGTTELTNDYQYNALDEMSESTR